MARNIEIKARVDDPEGLRARVESVADRGPVVMRQRDTFYRVPNGRLKLREIEGGAAELIRYHRASGRDPRPSDYEIVPVPDPRGLDRALEAALGHAGCVEKTRTLYLAGPTRIHLDEVVGLGSFLELEVVLDDTLGPDAGKRIARELMERLRVPTASLLSESYVELIVGSCVEADPDESPATGPGPRSSP